MKIKYNDATLNRPQGKRLLDAPYLRTDIRAFTEQVKSEKAWELHDRNSITVFKSDDLTIVLLLMKEGAVIKDNIVNEYLVLEVIEGKVRFETPEGDIELGDRNLVTFHPGIPHSIEAMTELLLLLSTYSTKKE